MRHLNSRWALVVLAILLCPVQASAQSADCDRIPGRGDTFVCRITGELPGSPPAEGGGGGEGLVWVSYPVVSSDGQGGVCVQTVWVQVAAEEAEAVVAWAQAVFARTVDLSLGGQIPPPCPEEVGGGGGVAGGLVRAEVVRRLPRPDPWIAPGWMLTGLRAFLETRLDRVWADTIGVEVAGRRQPVEVVAEAVVAGEWGDGHRFGPTTQTGGPWPDGRLWHVYRDRGQVVVRVWAIWQVRWRTPGGPWSQFTLQGSPAELLLPIREAQPVRLR